MAKLSNTPNASNGKYNKTVIGTPDDIYDNTFDSEFERVVLSSNNCVLRITLRLFFKQISPWQLPGNAWRAIAIAQGIPVPAGAGVGHYSDAENEARLIKEWSNQEWTTFIQGVHTQARLWDSQFWLIPPDDFSHLDIIEGSWVNKSGSTTTRPNIKCEFRLQIAPYIGAAHKIIEVVNVIDPRFFRSHSRLYTQDDTTVRPNQRRDAANNRVPTSQPVIAHEIGHALGMPHIGVSRNLAHCTVAVNLGRALPEPYIPALYKGERNADACYGTRSSSGDIDDIMGVGNKFGTENAKPWLNRLPEHFNLSGPERAMLFAGLPRWKVSKAYHPPMGIVKIR